VFLLKAQAIKLKTELSITVIIIIIIIIITITYGCHFLRKQCILVNTIIIK